MIISNRSKIDRTFEKIFRAYNRPTLIVCENFKFFAVIFNRITTKRARIEKYETAHYCRTFSCFTYVFSRIFLHIKKTSAENQIVNRLLCTKQIRNAFRKNATLLNIGARFLIENLFVDEWREHIIIILITMMLRILEYKICGEYILLVSRGITSSFRV